ncbi:MAG: peptide ABC transporter substrate-binding protein [Candidatus Sumerlaeia bacterium]|nr:peptide ABC transporter substrate-binding protein [Candidatus Sumerlaeia bacterium]
MNRRRKIRGAAQGVMFGLLMAFLAACRSEEAKRPVEQRQRAGELVFNLGSEPTTLDPARATRLCDLRVIAQCLEGLVRLNEAGQIEPAAAESWDVSPDRRVYRFRLRPARWSNGVPVTSADFAYGWRRNLNPATRSVWSDQFFHIEGARNWFQADEQKRATLPLGIETPDSQTLVVRLERPVPYFLSLAALEAWLPVHGKTAERLGEAAFRAPNYLSNGAFCLIEHRPRQRIVLEPNPHYWRRSEVTLNRITFTMVENEFTEWTAYRRGEIDITDAVHRSALDKLRGQPDFQSRPLLGLYYLCFNCERPPFNRPEVRRAFALAIDRRALVERILRSGELPATALVPPGVPEAQAEGKARDFRAEGGDLLPATAPDAPLIRQLLAAATNLPQPITYSHGASETYRSVAIALQMMWRDRLGVEVALQSSPARILAQSRRDGEYWIAGTSWVGDYLDATTFLDILRSDSAHNYSRWRNPVYDQLLDRAAATSDTAARAALLHQAERMVFEEMPICPIHFYTIAYLQRPGLAGISRNCLGRVDLSRAHWETGNKK